MPQGRTKRAHHTPECLQPSSAIQRLASAPVDSADGHGFLAELRRKAKKRRDVAGYCANVTELEARIAALEAQRAATLATGGA